MTDREALAALVADALNDYERAADLSVIVETNPATHRPDCIHATWVADRIAAALAPSLDEGLREERFGDDVMAALRLRLIRGATDATYTPREVAEMVSHVIEKQVRRLAQEGETPT